ncbi:hypothetical protein V8E55_007043 [Tylopilus felleus]
MSSTYLPTTSRFPWLSVFSSDLQRACGDTLIMILDAFIYLEPIIEAPTPSTAGVVCSTSSSVLSRAEPPAPPDTVSLLTASLGELSEQKDMGVDLFDVGLAMHAASLGVALDFVFPVLASDAGMSTIITYFVPSHQHGPATIEVSPESRLFVILEHFSKWLLPEERGLGHDVAVAYLPKDHALEIEPCQTLSDRLAASGSYLEYLLEGTKFSSLELCNDDNKIQFFVRIHPGLSIVIMAAG